MRLEGEGLTAQEGRIVLYRKLETSVWPPSWGNSLKEQGLEL